MSNIIGAARAPLVLRFSTFSLRRKVSLGSVCHPPWQQGRASSQQYKSVWAEVLPQTLTDSSTSNMIRTVLLVSTVATVILGYPEGGSHGDVHPTPHAGGGAYTVPHIDPGVHLAPLEDVLGRAAPQFGAGIHSAQPAVVGVHATSHDGAVFHEAPIAGVGVPGDTNYGVPAQALPHGVDPHAAPHQWVGVHASVPHPQVSFHAPALPHAASVHAPAPHHEVNVPVAAPPRAFSVHAVPHQGAGVHGPSSHGDGSPSYQIVPAKYSFEYAVQDEYSGNHFGHTESRDGYLTEGSYFVHLPDGRIQTVTYTADESGYHPTVNYEGNAVYNRVPVHDAGVPIHPGAAPVPYGGGAAVHRPSTTVPFSHGAVQPHQSIVSGSNVGAPPHPVTVPVSHNSASLHRLTVPVTHAGAPAHQATVPVHNTAAVARQYDGSPISHGAPPAHHDVVPAPHSATAATHHETIPIPHGPLTPAYDLPVHF
ncbi:uncharacterized protein LOC143035729 [Oratosquilla oratoria]|uniref:uncharacterized protein LOC143035729 n=1 Tax=Oratosquilla oratoria TaxID=337810 RepID=UPI003F76534E